ncbi:MAG TPA: SDR family NAD(P)-dependent oxidoreductase, partial [Croceibacterium sp.]|nr:SDR family NAD(P)-dependent oxidoreductase [Croceibacterium sp.]
MSDFAGHHVAVTGASSGIGLATAQMLARRGAKVSLLARRKELLDEAVAGIGATAAGFVADVGQKDQLDAALDAAAAQFGPVTGLFANAGLTGGFTPAVAFDPAVFEETIRVNLTSVFWAIQNVLPPMIAAKKGAILITGSMASKRGLPMNPAYVAS